MDVKDKVAVVTGGAIRAARRRHGLGVGSTGDEP
jgi:hypothetical protein